MQIFDGAGELANANKPTFFCGLDLGQQQDYSALVILERRGFSPENYSFDCRFIHRWQLKTSYTQIVEDVARWMNSEAVNKNARERPTLAIDKTGIGAAIYDLFQREKMNARLVPIVITGGDQVTKDGSTVRVPKRNLVSCVSVALETDKLKYSEQLPLTETLKNELKNFKAKTSDAGRDSYGAAYDWRVGVNDDLVLALSMALWTAADGVKPPTFYSF